jgi:Ice-binding-like
MNHGVPPTYQSLHGDRLAVSRQSHPGVTGHRSFRAALIFLGLISTLIFASSALGATATIGLGPAAGFSVLGGSTVTNTGPTTMFGDLGLSPGSSVTGAPHVLGQTHVDDAVAIQAKSALTTAYNNAASRPSNGSAGTDLAGQTFLAGVYTASSSLLLSSGSVTLDAQGNPDAVFIFQIASTLITGSSTTVQLVNGAQACNVFWQVGSSATLGTGARFVGTIMASKSVTAGTAATIHGRLLAQTAAVTLEANTITTSTCASSASGSGGGTEASTGAETTALEAAGAGAAAPRPPIGSRTVGKPGRKHTAHSRGKSRKAPKHHSPAHPALPHRRGTFTG